MISQSRFMGGCRVYTITADTTLTLSERPTRMFMLDNSSGSTWDVTLPDPTTVASRLVGLQLYFYNIGADDVVLKHALGPTTLNTLTGGTQHTRVWLGFDSSNDQDWISTASTSYI